MAAMAPGPSDPVRTEDYVTSPPPKSSPGLALQAFLPSHTPPSPLPAPPWPYLRPGPALQEECYPLVLEQT